MSKILIATVKPFAAEAVDGIKNIVEQAGFSFALLEKYDNKQALLSAVADVTAIIIRSDIIDKEVLDAASQLKIVVRAGAGYDNVDLQAASNSGVVVMNTPGQNANAVAELAIGMMIYLNRNGYNGKAGVELRNKTLGIHAYGHIGKLVGTIAKGLGMTVNAHDPFISKETIEADGINCIADVKEFYKNNQYISVNLPANDKTKGMINYSLLSLMPQGATLVNTARKEIIDEASVLKMFAERPDFRYITDVAPDCKDEIEAKYEGRFFFTPKKMGAQTAEANINAGLAAAQQIVKFLNNGDTTFQVNK